MSPEAARLAAAYDAVPYDPPHGDAFDLAVLRGAAAALGHHPAPGDAPDVLDIGCGAGGVLARAAAASEGRMVGIDASATLVELARARGAAFGPRFEVRHADAAAIDPAALGSFDVVYIVGTLFIVPPGIRAAMLALAGACLRPGGLLVVNGYTGIVGHVRASLGAVLRAENDPSLSPGDQVTRARANIRMLHQNLPQDGPLTPVLRTVLERFAALSIPNLFHEALGPGLQVLDAGSLSAALAPAGIGLLNCLPPLPLDQTASPDLRARAFDVRNLLAGGGYHSFLFARPLPDAASAGARHARVVWSSPLRPSGERDGAPAYADPATGTGLRVPSPFNQAALDTLARGPATWSTLRAAGAAADPGGEPLVHARLLDELLDTMWRARLATPLWR